MFNWPLEFWKGSQHKHFHFATSAGPQMGFREGSEINDLTSEGSFTLCSIPTSRLIASPF